MSGSSIQTILSVAGSDWDDTFWTQILVFLLLAASWGVYTLVKNKPNRPEDREQDFIDEPLTHHTKSRRRLQMPRQSITQHKTIVQKYAAKLQNTRPRSLGLTKEPGFDFDSPDTSSQLKDRLSSEKTKNLHSGMELLELDSLLTIVENTKGKGKNDVTIRKLNFSELIRREKLNQLNSNALKVYAINQGNLYSKVIQCEAIKELAGRTVYKTKRSSQESNLRFTKSLV